MRIQTLVRWCPLCVLLVAVTACGGGDRSSTPLGPSSEPPAVIYDSGTPGVTLPTVVREVKPQYPAAALARRIQGSVLIGAVVQADGTLTDVTVLRSVDAVYGLDDAALAAARQWLFNAGTKDGKAVAQRITIELTFTIRE